MSSSLIIPKERLSAYQRWELGSFNLTAATGNSAAALPTVEQLERIEQQAREEGHAAGYLEGKTRAESEAQRLGMLMESLDRELQQFDQGMAQDLLNLALDTAKQVLCQALKVRPEFVLPVVQEAIRALPHFSQHARLVLNPEDGALVRAHLGDQLAQSGWQLVEDARMQRGGCRIETAHGQIDASLASRWHRVLAALGQDSRWLE